MSRPGCVVGFGEQASGAWQMFVARPSGTKEMWEAIIWLSHTVLAEARAAEVVEGMMKKGKVPAEGQDFDEMAFVVSRSTELKARPQKDCSSVVEAVKMITRGKYTTERASEVLGIVLVEPKMGDEPQDGKGPIVLVDQTVGPICSPRLHEMIQKKLKGRYLGQTLALKPDIDTINLVNVEGEVVWAYEDSDMEWSETGNLRCRADPWRGEKQSAK